MNEDQKSNNDPRLKDLINTGRQTKPSVVQIFGFPSDMGVKINGGRPGAARAPELIIEELLKLTPHPQHQSQHQEFLKRVSLEPTVVCRGNVEMDQKQLGSRVAKVLNKNIIPVILGGGHETAFGHFLGYVETNTPVTILNIDAHADVRVLKDDKAHSGSPFRQAIEHNSGLCNSYSVFGLNPFSVSSEHYQYVNNQGVAKFAKETTKKEVLRHLNIQRSKNIMITMDMDAVAQSAAPGVSAPNASGISPSLWLELAFGFGKHPGVTSFDLCEVNPEYDRDHQTVKLAALTVWYFLRGVAMRKNN